MRSLFYRLSDLPENSREVFLFLRSWIGRWVVGQTNQIIYGNSVKLSNPHEDADLWLMDAQFIILICLFRNVTIDCNFDLG